MAQPSAEGVGQPAAAEEPNAEPATDAEHAHGPFPSFEWILEGKRETVLPHLTSIAPQLTFEDEHFHATKNEAQDEYAPELFDLDLGGELVGGLDFLPLPNRRTLMRLYLCSDLGRSCRIDGGDDVMRGFATAWLARLQTLGFMAKQAAVGKERDARPLGFQPPAGSEAEADEATAADTESAADDRRPAAKG